MIKHPALRVRSFLDIDKAFLQGLIDDCFAFIALTPYADLVVDLQGCGSYARECAELHSDMDINIAFASEADRLLARERIKENREQFGKAVVFLNALRRKYKLMIELALQHDSLASTPKSYYSFKENKLYSKEKAKIDIDYVTKAVSVRSEVRVRPPRLSLGVIDDDGVSREYDPRRDTLDMVDPWFTIVPEWKKKYGSKFLALSETAETAYMKP